MILLQSRTHLQKKIFLQEKRCFQLPSADLDSTTLEKCSTKLGAPKCRFVFVFVFVLSCVLKISMIVTFACHHSSSITLWYSVQNLISYNCRQVPVKLPRQVCSRVIQVPKPAPVVHHAVHQPVLTAPHHGLHHGNPSLLKNGPTQSPKNPVHIRYSLESLTKKYVFLCYQLSQHINQNSFCNLPHTSRLTGSGKKS